MLHLQIISVDIDVEHYAIWKFNYSETGVSLFFEKNSFYLWKFIYASIGMFFVYFLFISFYL